MPRVRPAFFTVTPEHPTLTPDEEKAVAEAFHKPLRDARDQWFKNGRNRTPPQSRQSLKFQPTPERPRRPAARTMSKADILGEIVTEWAKLNAAEMASVLGQFRRCPAIAGRSHVSTLAKVKPGVHLVGRPDAAKLLGIPVGTLDAWDRRGWIVGKIKANNTCWYPKTEVTKARKRAEKRKGKY